MTPLNRNNSVFIVASFSLSELYYATPGRVEYRLNRPEITQGTIRQQLRDGRSQLLKAAYLETLRDQAKVENFFAEEILKNDAK